jgi:hypothetical protein
VGVLSEIALSLSQEDLVSQGLKHITERLCRLRLGIFRGYYGVAFADRINSVRPTRSVYVTSCPEDAGEYVMDTNSLLIILVVIFLFGGFGFYGRGRWF